MKRVLYILTGAVIFSGCGLEALFFGGFDEEHQRPLSRISGSVILEAPELKVTKPDGEAVELVEVEASGGTYSVGLPSSAYSNLRVEASQGQANVRAIVYEIAAESSVDNVDLDVASTTEVLVIEAALGPAAKTLAIIEPSTLRGSVRILREQMETGTSSAAKLLSYVQRIVDAANRDDDSGTLALQTPVLSPSFATLTSAVNPGWLAGSGVDFDGDGMADTATTAKFDRLLAQVAEEFPIEGCPDPDKIRVVFVVDFNAGRLDDNCEAIQRFRWVQDQPGKQMYIVGGIHMESPVQDPVLDAEMSNTGGWVPNQVPMYDDGTNGDAVAGDNVWTRYFDVPRGARLGYKYTWGKRGDLWTGTEEWPGNQRILEAVDVNGDDIIYRYDDFADEATNKDKVNLNRRGNGNVTWDTDVNGDGVPDVRERMVDLDNNCTLDAWVTPSGVGPRTVDCGTLGQ